MNKPEVKRVSQSSVPKDIQEWLRKHREDEDCNFLDDIDAWEEDKVEWEGEDEALD